MAAIRVRTWAFIHRWSSLVCMVFMLAVCLTGLPLIFAEEIEHWLHDEPVHVVAAGGARADIDLMLVEGLRRFPGEIVTSIVVDDDEGHVLVWLAPSWEAVTRDPRINHAIKFDVRTGEVLKQADPADRQRLTFMTVMRRLHIDLFADLPGRLFLGSMGLLLILALVSGVVLYAPFMRHLPFGAVRADRSRRIRWLDLHNLLGAVTALWLLVVAVTGVINELTTPVFALWQRTELQDVLRPWRGTPPPAPAELSSARLAIAQAERARPEMQIVSVVYPGFRFGSPHHYLIWMKGRTALTAHLFVPVLVDAREGQLTAVVRVPWYLWLLEVSRPLHFGNYGGLPLKMLWAVLDILTIVVLASGLYLWAVRRSPRRGAAASRDCKDTKAAAVSVQRAQMEAVHDL